MNLQAGNYALIYGGSKEGTITGDTSVTIGGSVNSGIDITDHSLAETKALYGGCYNGIVKGNTNVTVEGSAKISVGHGGGWGTKSEVQGVCNLTVNGGSAMGYYGGSLGGKVKDTNFKMTAGTVQQIFGGSWTTSKTSNVNVTFTGNTRVEVIGGTITRRIYGGCYNEADVGFTSVSYSTECYVKGTTEVIIGGSANYTHSGSIETAICAGSRHKTNHSAEQAVLRVENQTLYNKIKGYIGDSTWTEVSGYDQLYINGVLQ
jgi:hypothetical protein